MDVHCYDEKGVSTRSRIRQPPNASCNYHCGYDKCTEIVIGTNASVESDTIVTLRRSNLHTASTEVSRE